MLVPGTTLRNHYYIIKKLGSGGFGDTYLAQDQDLPGNDQCVVKHLKPKSSDPEVLSVARRLFDSEAQVLHKLGNDSDQIPRLFAHFEENGEFYLVQEFVDGQDLSQELTPGKQSSEKEVVKLLQDILEVLKVVHENNVIHRDIKPQNIMRRQKDGKIVLIDFGAVKEISTLRSNPQGQTIISVAVGTHGYMPSEQASGKPKLCSDVYAVGMIGISALTGIRPTQLPEDSNTGEVIWRDRAQVNPKLADILDKMVRYHFNQRYQDAAEALDALEAWQSHTTIPLPRSQPSPNRLPSKVLSGLMGLSIITAVYSLAVYIIGTPPNPKPSNLELSNPEPLQLPVSEKYNRLENLLAARKWKEADQESSAIVLKISDRAEASWLEPADTQKLPCQDLRRIDNLWARYSNGRFGITVQKDIWESSYVDKNYNIFADTVGWRVQNMLQHHNLNFTSEALKGHLPWHSWQVNQNFFRVGFGAFMSRVAQCQLQPEK